MIEAYLRTQDEKRLVKFDMTPWLKFVSLGEIDLLIQNPVESHFSEDVAYFCSDEDQNLFEAIEYSKKSESKILVVVKIAEIQVWLREHRPDVYQMLYINKHLF